MDIEPVLAAIDAMSPGERWRVRAHLEVLEGGIPQQANPPVADSASVQAAGRELMGRFPASMRKLAGT
jgi:hypothetical protein